MLLAACFRLWTVSYTHLDVYKRQVLAMLPMFLLAMYEKNGQPLEVIIRQFVEVKFLRPKERPYQTNNFYTALAPVSYTHLIVPPF